MTINFASIDSGTPNEQTSPLAPSSAADIEHRFLKLLVTQMKNQDPLNPLDNAQLTTQLAQISTVSGIDRINATLSAIAAQLSAAKPAAGSDEP